MNGPERYREAAGIAEHVNKRPLDPAGLLALALTAAVVELAADCGSGATVHLGDWLEVITVGRGSK